MKDIALGFGFHFTTVSKVVRGGDESRPDPGLAGLVNIQFTIEAPTSTQKKNVGIGQINRVSKLVISYGKNFIHVPKSSYLDLWDVRGALFESVGEKGKLTLKGGDGAESYTVELLFNNLNIDSKKTMSDSKPEFVTEHAIYKLSY